MSQQKYISKNQVRFVNSVGDWKEAIQEAALPLLEENIIKESYIEAMINNVSELGPYIVLVPKVAMPHARPETGAIRTGFSILKLQNSVSFGNNQEVEIIICLAAKDNKEHLEALQMISSLIDDEDKVNQLLQTKTVDSFVELAEVFINEEEEE